MPLRPSRVAKAAVVTSVAKPGPSPVAKVAVVGAAVSPGPSPVAKTAVVAAAVTPGPRENLLMIGKEYDRDKEKAIFIYSLKLANSNLEVLQVLDEFRNEVSPNQLKLYEPIFCWSTSKDNIYTANENRGYDIWVYDFKKGTKTNLSSEAPVVFVDEEDDHPAEKPIFGLAGWTKDSKAVIINHKYDLWLLPLAGINPTNITQSAGSREEIRFRYLKLDAEEKFINTSKPLLLSAYGEWTKKSGFYSLKIGAEPQRLIYTDKRFSTPLKSKKAAILMYTRETFIDFPD